MSRYLQRVLARTVGQPLGALQAPRPLRWSSAPAGGGGAVDRAAEPAAAHDGGARAIRDRLSPPSAARSTLGGAAAMDGAADRVTPEPGDRARRAGAPGQPSTGSPSPQREAPAAGVRSARPEHLAPAARPADAPRSEGREPEAAASTSTRMPGSRGPATVGAPVEAKVPASGEPAPLRASPRRARGFDGEAASRIAMPLPPARRDPVTTRAPAASLHDPPIPGGAAPPVAARPPAPPRAERVIGRITVVVDSVRPPVAPPHIVVRPAAAAPADDGAGPPRFGRFGLGQL